ncbi:MAG TPA: hypothetical protein VMS88_08910, partial [Terriglobales bacterium]|nr:hypothetical protein [Terriglobales bacterium]
MAVLPILDTSPAPWLGSPLIVALLLVWLARTLTANREAREQKRAHTLDDAEALIENGLHEKAAAILPHVRDGVDRERGAEGLARSARWHLAWGECRAEAGAFADARTALETALRTSAQAGEPHTTLLRIRARTELAFLGLSGAGISDEALGRAAEMLKDEQAITDPLALGRLAWLALRLGQAEHTLGRWEAARAHFSDALRIALRVDPPSSNTAQFGWALEKQLRRWANARAAGAFAALTLGQVLASVGDQDGSRTWLDRAIAALEGPEHMITHHARAMVSLERARLEPAGALSGPARSASWYEAAVREGIACGLPNGRLLACQADLELAAQFMTLDDPVHALGHARRAAEHLKTLPADAVGPIALEARLAIGAALAETAETDKARQTLREVLETGRTSWHPDARRHAAVAAWRLFFVLLEDDQLADAGQALAALEQLVPGLAPVPRPFFAALAKHLRGVLGLREARIDEARRMLESAEASARALGGGAAADLARAAAAGRGQAAA